MLLAAIALTACGGDDGSAPPTTTEAPATTAPATTTTEASSVDVMAALVKAGDLPETWRAADDEVGQVDLATGFCGRFVSVRHLESVRTRPFAASDTGPWIVSGVAVFDTGGAAGDYLDAVANTADCPEWTDDSGAHNAVQSAPEPDESGVDQARAFRQTVAVDTASFAIDIAYLRSDRAIAFLTRTARTDAPTDVDWGALISLAATRLPGAVEQ